ncbi:MAG: hypothetical protein WC627_04270 [Legionella sp.]|jgi:hypothetical protein
MRNPISGLTLFRTLAQVAKPSQIGLDEGKHVAYATRAVKNAISNTDTFNILKLIAPKLFDLKEKQEHKHSEHHIPGHSGFFSHPVFSQISENFLIEVKNNILPRHERKQTLFAHGSRALAVIIQQERLKQSASLQGGVVAWSHLISPYKNSILKDQVLTSRIIIVPDIESLKKVVNDLNAKGKLDKQDTLYFEPNTKIQGEKPVFLKSIIHAPIKIMNSNGELVDDPVPIIPHGVECNGNLFLTPRGLEKTYENICMKKNRTIVDEQYEILMSALENPDPAFQAYEEDFLNVINTLKDKYKKIGESWAGVYTRAATDEQKVAALCSLGVWSTLDISGARNTIVEIMKDDAAEAVLENVIQEQLDKQQNLGYILK